MKHMTIDEIEAVEVKLPVRPMEPDPEPGPHDRLIEAIRNGIEYEGNPVRFDMSNFCETLYEGETACGTAACIAGYAKILIRQETGKDVDDEFALEEYLGVSREEAELIAYADDGSRSKHGGPMRLRDITAEEAIRMLEIHRDSLRVDWAAVWAETRGSCSCMDAADD